jgi:small-conductance mechanosensitive channel/CRP-like cAMP-binding protein
MAPARHREAHMNVWSGILSEVIEAKTGELSLAAVLLFAAGGLAGRAEAGRRRGVVVLFVLHLLLIPVGGALRGVGSTVANEVRLAALILATLSLIGMSGTLLFSIALPRLRVQMPKILQDVLVALSALIAIFMLASRAGLNLSGLIATSAVLTAVIGLAFQDTLGNVVGGLTLQLDDSIDVGDWIRVGDVVGRVAEIRWRYTALETRNWETVILPNSLLVKGQVTIIGRRKDAPLQHRRWVYFNVDFRYAPSEVLRIATDAVRGAPMDNVAETPKPDCVLMDLQESYCRYAVRYWVKNLAVDDPTDSLIRTRLFFALRRADIPLSIPAHAIFMTEDSSERKEEKGRAEIERRMTALSQVGIFAALSEDERTELADHLRYAPFAAGETMTRQGAEAHWLYMIIEGEVSVRVARDGGQQEVARLKSGDFFGEMSLLTGEPRAATVESVTAVECYRLDKAAFQGLLSKRPEVAETIADLLARRKSELSTAREHLDADADGERIRITRTDLLGKIRNFFALDGHSKG